MQILKIKAERDTENQLNGDLYFRNDEMRDTRIGGMNSLTIQICPLVQVT